MEHKFTTANFAVEVLDSNLPVLVDFYADWCGPCKMMGPIVKELADSYDGKMKIGKLNIDEEMDIAIVDELSNGYLFTYSGNTKDAKDAMNYITQHNK